MLSIELCTAIYLPKKVQDETYKQVKARSAGEAAAHCLQFTGQFASGQTPSPPQISMNHMLTHILHVSSGVVGASPWLLSTPLQGT